MLVADSNETSWWAQWQPKVEKYDTAERVSRISGPRVIVMIHSLNTLVTAL